MVAFVKVAFSEKRFCAFRFVIDELEMVVVANVDVPNIEIVPVALKLVVEIFPS